MNRIQKEVLRAIAFQRFDDTRGLPEADEHPCLRWLAANGYIDGASWRAEVTQDGYLAGIASGALTMYFVLSDELVLKVFTYGPGSTHSSYEPRARYLAAVKRGLLSGALKLVESGAPSYYQVVVR